ncbi:YajQ family cyclic di-GMP-binding protein [Thalassotalea agarivorans]|uniref:Nucleotide-binding protein SAMN05660429_00756 n=1 Tax=Thalassotalea agarivorans TaxID=349064 RepID=A0A1I0AML0_THASX|nr:YajQ family cyclic di-GMP-binding protein [Thalassotalea agarivorans]SES95403.1 hypothetical protein SAMN05660429_00756 [Thalassotalea agarivorans]
MPSFDIVSETDMEEVRNATENATRDLATRWDFKNVEANFEWNKPNVKISSESDYQLTQLVDILRNNLTRRKVDPQAMDVGEPQASGKNWWVSVAFKEGIEQPVAKKIVKLIKDSKLKVQAAIQGDSVRVTGKKRDDLQAVMQLVREAELGQSFQFNNFRD